MASSAGTPDVGAIDPQLKTSPVLEQTAEEPYGPRQAVAGDAWQPPRYFGPGF
jgi:hypothetical protein